MKLCVKGRDIDRERRRRWRDYTNSDTERTENIRSPRLWSAEFIQNSGDESRATILIGEGNGD